MIRAGVAQGRIDQVFAGETRPWLQGARLTVWELQQDGIDATLIADSAASHLMKTGAVQWVVVGADRICANGDTANKIGTYQLAIAARHHGVKFMVVAPSSTVDMDTRQRRPDRDRGARPGEMLGIGGVRTVAEGIACLEPGVRRHPARADRCDRHREGRDRAPDEPRCGPPSADHLSADAAASGWMTAAGMLGSAKRQARTHGAGLIARAQVSP